jgi:hypothetical protein
MRIILPIVLAFTSSVAVAQTTGDPQRGNTPPGMSRDGARPADGAIKGGPAAGGTAIMPGEQGGLPNKDIQRCNELSGSLREECLKKERDGSAGAGGTMPSTPREPTDILKK